MIRLVLQWSVVLLLGTASLHAQIGKHIALRSESSLRQHANDYFERQAYSHAAKLYSKIIREHPEDQDIRLKLGDCYRLLREPHSAVQWYRIALEANPSSTEHIFHFAAMLTATRKYDEAKIWYKKYLKAVPNDQRALAALESLKQPHLLEDNRFEVQQLAIDMPGAVFSPAIFNDGLVFVGEGSTGSVVRKMTTWIEGPYFDLYYVPLNNDKPGFPKYLDDNLNSALHEGPVTFYDNDTKVIFTRSASKKGEEDTRNLQLMTAELKPSGNWSSPKELFSNYDYSIGHPAVNREGDVIYFSSNKPGGYGGSDLYRSEFKNGSWQEPVNAGPEINTAGNELFPSIDENGALYFSSNGHGGLGGLEILKVHQETGKPVNMGYPINSSGDDFGIVWKAEDEEGFFSTNRTGDDRIFKFQLNPQLAKAVVPDN